MLAESSNNMLEYLNGGSAKTSVGPATSRQKLKSNLLPDSVQSQYADTGPASHSILTQGQPVTVY